VGDRIIFVLVTVAIVLLVAAVAVALERASLASSAGFLR
jgi:hypothetical protein